MAWLLAAKSENSPIVFVVFVAIWIVFSIISAISKKQEEEKRKRVREQIERGMPIPPPIRNEPQPMRAPDVFQPQVQRRTFAKPHGGARPQPAVRQQATQVTRGAPQQQQQRRAPVARETKRSAPRAAPPPIPGRNAVVQSVVASLPPAKRDISDTEIRGADEKRASSAVNADSLHRWLRPATLRQQFMLTEVLQPPLALRPEHD